MGLSKYSSKRDLTVSKEPPAKVHRRQKQLIFVIQEHHARRLHWDLRLEAEGVLKSWAVPKEPSMDSQVKRLAIEVEDHPYDYKDFEGNIPEGYGAGDVYIWDKGTYDVDALDAKESEKAILAGLKKGHIHFTLYGKRLHGIFNLVRIKTSEKNEWLLIKKEGDAMPGPVKAEKAKLSNVDKLYWPKEKITKGDLIAYYEEIAPIILPYLKNRPMSLKRFPEGIDGISFFQKNLVDYPDWIETVKIPHSDKIVNYLLIQNKESLLYAANLGCIEMHPFFSRVGKLEYPDYLIFDLDPKTASFDAVIKVAQELHRTLEECSVPNYCKTSGSTGLHIAVPLGAKYDYEQAKHFAEIIAILTMKRIPAISTMERSIVKRRGKVYIDCYQNNFGQTVASAYSVRAKPGATVSTPLDWSEVKKGLKLSHYNLKTVPSRIQKLGDIYKPVLGKGVDIIKILKTIGELSDF